MNINEARAKLIALEQQHRALEREAWSMRKAIADMYETDRALRKHIEALTIELNRLRPQPMPASVRESLASFGLEALARYDAARAFSSEVCDDVE